MYLSILYLYTHIFMHLSERQKGGRTFVIAAPGPMCVCVCACVRACVRVYGGVGVSVEIRAPFI